jgi:hypothetical protein
VETLEGVNVHFPSVGVALVVFAGVHDVATSSATRDFLRGLIVENDLVIADFCSASFIDISMLRVLFEAERWAGELGRVFRLQLTTC